MKRPQSCGCFGTSVLLAGVALVFFFAWPTLRDVIGGASSGDPAASASALSPEARALLERATSDLDPARLQDLHVHVAGLGVGGTGCFVNPEMRSWLHPWKRLQFSIYLSAAGVDDLERADAQYVERLIALARAFPVRGRFGLLALDRRRHADGTPDDEGTQLYVPNEYVAKLAELHPDLFVPVISVHPYRPDALAELDRFGARGARLVKWLPNSMGIDPSDPRCDAFYERMRKWDMTLLSHAGDEHAVAAAAGQELGNPLLLRRALDRGVRVIVAHCATLGKGADLDDPARKRVANFELFLRLMDDPRYTGLVFGELSAVCQINRDPHVLRTLLERGDLHARLVNGSDWPLPAINSLVSTRRLENEGFLTRDERRALNEIYDHDPLLFDLALKRTLRGAHGERFPASVFESNPAIGP